MIVQVKYCGGCNPRYERTAFLAKLVQEFPEIEFWTEPSAQAAAGLVICGCDTACAETADCIGSSGRMVIWKESAMDAARRFLKELLRKEEGEEL